MNDTTIWWVLAGAIVAIELITGTVYLLLISLGLAAGAMAAHLGLPISVQIWVAAAVGGGTVVIWRAYRKARLPSAALSTVGEVSLDVGEVVHIDHWSDDGTSSTKYRGANWQVSLMPGEQALLGAYRIAEVAGNRLIIKKI
jgi:membrane protein implicated in regulation of membrane protease activity